MEKIKIEKRDRRGGIEDRKVKEIELKEELK